MKRKLIRNPVLRWFAGLGVILWYVALAGVVLVGIYWIGILTSPIWIKAGISGPADPLPVIFIGSAIATIMFLFVAICVAVVIFYVVQAIGDIYFNQSAESQKPDPQSTASQNN